MTRELLETLSGVGLVQRMDTRKPLRSMRYQLMVYREMIEGVPRKQVVGQLDLEPFDDVFGVSLRLTLEDGREIEFFVADMDGAMAILDSEHFRDIVP